jgi:hypothetical protein
MLLPERNEASNAPFPRISREIKPHSRNRQHEFSILHAAYLPSVKAGLGCSVHPSVGIPRHSLPPADW